MLAKVKTKKFLKQLVFLIDILLALSLSIINLNSTISNNLYMVFFGFVPLAIINTYFIGWKYIERTYFEIFKWKRIGMNFLVFASTQISLIYSLIEIIYYLNRGDYLELHLIEIPIFVIIFVKIGDLINDYIKSKIGNDLKKIQSLQSKNAFLLRNEEYIKVNVNQISAGDIIKVPIGYNVPMDGILISKQALVDSQLINGENHGLEISYKDNVFAGMRNMGEEFSIEATGLVKDNLINKMVKKINQIQTEKKGIQTIVDRVLLWFTPVVLVLSILGFFISYFFFENGSFLLSLKVSITVLVSACPCAIGLATPLAILIGASRAAKKGVIFNKPESFSKLHTISTVVFDKTGTLTKGEIEVKDYIGDEKYLPIIGSFQLNIKHPIASGIVNYLNKKNIDCNIKLRQIDKDFLTFTYLDDHYQIIKYSNFKSAGSAPEINFRQTTNTSSLLFKNKNLVAQIFFEDKLREGVDDKIQELMVQGFKVVMITGDNIGVAKKVASSLKIKHVYANMTPDKKLLLIKEMQMNGEKVLFAGDGLNDALAIKQADLSIAVITKSTYLDLDADIALLDSKISLIVDTINEVKNTKKIIYSNLFWAFTYNLIIIPLALFGVLSPHIGMLAMFLSSILVLLNSLYFKMKK
ncbi:heavy metal translocating P-type ATPase [Mesoplasma corruscae]|uniref:Copper transporting ATPase n=1 Tax=Mesoplasma corruscae TaxID=216874 RepID=A0A2S5RG48_9MOLU|nr:cation-translocating P-type ATPase [Mesoplasma corruscae]PPE06283.1 copper transporting ATPase [Mesoplasma corruscae]